MINYYLIIGLLWIAFSDFVVKVKVEGEPMNNLARFINFILWPFSLVVFIYGVIVGFINHRKNNE